MLRGALKPTKEETFVNYGGMGFEMDLVKGNKSLITGRRPMSWHMGLTWNETNQHWEQALEGNAEPLPPPSPIPRGTRRLCLSREQVALAPLQYPPEKIPSGEKYHPEGASFGSRELKIVEDKMELRRCPIPRECPQDPVTHACVGKRAVSTVVLEKT